MRGNLGDKVKCKFTGIEGIVIGTSKYIFGCDRLGIQPKAKDDNKVPDQIWGDIDNFEVLETKVVIGHTEIPSELKNWRANNKK